MDTSYKSQRTKTYIFYSVVFLLFCTCYSCLTYNQAWMLELGFSNTAIGLVQSMNSIFAFLLPPFFGIIADKIRSTRKALAITIIINVIGFCMYPYLTSFVPFLLASSVFAGVRSATDSLNTTWVVSEIENAKKKGIILNYGSIRIWGSLGYSLVCILLNICISSFGLTTQGTFYVGAVTMGIYLMFTVFGGKKNQESDSSAKLKKSTLTLKELKPGRLAKNYYYVTYLVVFVLLYLASCFNLNYVTNQLIELNIDISVMGTISGVRACFEIPGIFFSTMLAKKFGQEKCLIASGIVFILESFVFYTSESLAMIMAAEILHGLFDGLFMGIYATYILKLVPRSLIATTQTLNNAMANMISMIFYLIGGIIVDNYGVKNVFIVGAIIPAIGVLFFIVTLYIGKVKKIKRYSADNDPVEQELMAKL